MNSKGSAPINLYIVLSDLCNFTCGHCINSSGPKANRWRISPKEISELAKTINSDARISRVHFSGGEPTLHKDWIQSLQSEVTRPVRYEMTTNGWQGVRVKEFLDQVQMHDVVLSYDRYHAPFVSMDHLVSFVDTVTVKGLNVTVNTVFDELSDLELVTPLTQAGAKLEVCKLVKGGRGRELQSTSQAINDPQAIQGTCPSLENKEYEKVIYVPGRGFTPCCGPLVFDELISTDAAFSQDLAIHPSNSLRAKLNCGDFKSTLDLLGIDSKLTTFESRCGACSYIHKGIGSNAGPSLFDIAHAKGDTQYYGAQEVLAKDLEQVLTRRFNVSYVYTLPVQAQRSQPAPISACATITATALNADFLPQVEGFMRQNYYAAYAHQYSPSQIQDLPKGINHYYKLGKAQGTLYFKGDQLVAVLLFNDYAEHPGLNVPTRHVGYWGYDRSRLSQPEARFIKASWFELLTNAGSINTEIDCSIDSFNTAALQMVVKSGLNLRMLRLDRKDAE